ncbi:hypothetical protein GCM10023216_05930 [Isoptericola chiayiensis]|uniref:Glycosyl transferase family 1 domain-containing protein n=1 Tax=Isoptericola chiayiensis TaxID=579446 RepID=A0ABP8Y3L4_9MICO|nr:glycosyltransferase family 4 protein [Isoptericola chiayiensis]NOV99448.1 UDP-glucose:(heptosyl)LPS alpha-1,3-glucosyltransferase [Isoptericola chiayiensis]
MIVVQICPEIGPGTGVGGVAAELESAWDRAGVETKRFTLEDSWGGWIPAPSTSIGGRLALLARVVWFSTVGTVLARRYCRSIPGSVSICHNDALAGDAYVNHGLVQVAMRGRGHARWRLARNPMHLFVLGRDAIRYRFGVHRVVVNLSPTEDDLLHDLHPGLRTTTAVIGNGVDLDRFRPPTPEQRKAARDRYGFGPGQRVVLFVGNEHDRKGLPALLDAIPQTGAHLLVVGGDAQMVSVARRHAETSGITDRCVFTGPESDVVTAFHASDALCLPSAYESFGLVYLEALAAGLPVVATPVGVVPEVVIPSTGRMVSPAPESVARGLTEVLELDPTEVREATRRMAERWSWNTVATRYLEVLSASSRDGRREGAA